jgi:hypothetical protein
VALGSQIYVATGDQQVALAVLGELTSGATAAGTSQSTAYAITTANTVFTTVAAGTGARLPVTPTVSANDRLHVANHGANTLAVYPPTGGKLSNRNANVPALIAPNKCAEFLCLDGTNYSALLSA